MFHVTKIIINLMALPEIVGGFGRAGGGPKGVPFFGRGGGGEVEGLPAYTNQGPPARPSLWMPLPLLASPYKGEESEGRPHKSLKSLLSYLAPMTEAISHPAPAFRCTHTSRKFAAR